MAFVVSSAFESPPDREEFIESQVAFQFGTCQAPRNLDLVNLAQMEAPGRYGFSYHNPADHSFVPKERAADFLNLGNGRWRRATEQNAQARHKSTAARQSTLLTGLLQSGLRSPVLMDMRDAVQAKNVYPVFQYTRLGGAENAILWPFDRIHKIGKTSFCLPPDSSEPALGDKKPVLSWRGTLRGYSNFGGKVQNIRVVVANFLKQKIDKDSMLAHLATIPRYAFVSRFFGIDGFDVGFNQPKATDFFRRVPEIARFEKAYASPQEQLQNKYQISIRGTDVGTSFGWQLGTNSVILREPYPWQVFFDGHFRPWDHYVPVTADFSDVPVKIAWCEKNPDACRRMIALRHAAVQLLLDRPARAEALRRVVARYDDFYERWSAG